MNETCPAYVPIEERIENFKLFYDQKNTRKLLGFFHGSEYPVFRYPAASCLPEGRPLDPEDFRVEDYVSDSESLHRLHEECGGDFIWSGSPYWGIPWLEVAMGLAIEVDHGTGSIFSKSSQTVTSITDIPDYSPDNRWVEKCGEFLSCLALSAERKYPIGTTRMRGVADLLSAILGTEKLIMAMVDTPREVAEAGRRIADFYIRFLDFQLERIRLFHGGVGSFYYGMWAPAGTVWHQEDSAMLLSPGLFEEFILPFDRTIYGSFESNICHFHSCGGYIPVDHILDLNPTAIEYHIDEGGPSAEELFSRHLSILEKSPLLIWGDLTKQDLDWVFSRLPTEGLAVCQVVSTKEEAWEIWEEYGGRE